MDESQRSVQSPHPTDAFSREGAHPSSFGSLVEEGPTLEVRWIRRGALTAPMIDWFGAFGRNLETLGDLEGLGDVETREDVYLVSERIRGLSVKIRGGAQLDLKVVQGIRGILDVKGRAEGEIESWQKFAFPLPPALGGDIDLPGWINVRKDRHIRRFTHVDGVPVEQSLEGIDAPRCAVELTDVSVDDERWWTLGFEATGPAEALQGAVAAVAALVFVDRIPDTEALTAADSMSYTDWLRTRLPDQARRG